jgi:hypothetical protein
MRTRRLGAGGARLAKHSGNSGAGVQSVAVCWWCPSRVGPVGSVRFSSRAGRRVAGVSKQLVCAVRKLLCGIRVLGAERAWVVSRLLSGLSTFPGSGSGGGAAFFVC